MPYVVLRVVDKFIIHSFNFEAEWIRTEEDKGTAVALEWTPEAPYCENSGRPSIAAEI